MLRINPASRISSNGVFRQVGGKVESETMPKHDAIGSHSSRNTYVSLMMEHGLSPKEMVDVMHSDLGSLRDYAGKEEDDQLASVMTSLFRSHIAG